jgi:hypothetical protein
VVPPLAENYSHNLPDPLVGQPRRPTIAILTAKTPQLEGSNWPMMGGQNGFKIFKTPFDSHAGISTIWDSHPVASFSWLQLRFAAGVFAAPLRGRAGFWSGSFFDNLVF